MQHAICSKYGFNKQTRASRLALLNFSGADPALGQQLQKEVILPCLPQITEQFYAALLAHPESRDFLGGTDLLRRLKLTHQAYLRTLGINYDSADYFEVRLKAGITHARIGLPLSTYLAAFQLLTELIINHFPVRIEQEREHCMALIRFVNKIAALDMSLAVEVYHSSTVQNLVSSIDHLQDEKASLSSRVERDELTRVGSRYYIFSALEAQLQMARQSPAPWCIAMADLDHFKEVNDAQGHRIGDMVLSDVAGRINAAIRGQDIMGRYGGEEFMIILPYTTIKVAGNIAERIRVHVAQTPVNADGHVVNMSISIGVTHYQPGDTADSIIERADIALYNAKHSGRNRVESQ